MVQLSELEFELIQLEITGFYAGTEIKPLCKGKTERSQMLWIRKK